MLVGEEEDERVNGGNIFICIDGLFRRYDPWLLAPRALVFRQRIRIRGGTLN